MNVRTVCLMLVSVCFLISAPLTVSAQQDTSSRADRQKPFLGIHVGPLSERMRSVNEISVESGVVVTHVVPDTPAERAGLDPFDVIQAIGGTPVSSVSELRKKIRSRSPGDRISLTVHRSGVNVQVRTRLSRYDRSKKSKGVSGPAAQRDDKKMEELMEKMGEVEKPEHSGSPENKRSARKPERLRKKMKSFLEENGTEPTGETKDKSDKKTSSSEDEPGEFERLYRTLKESLPEDAADRLNPEQFRELTEQTRQWLRETSAEDVKSSMTELLDKMKQRIKSLDGEHMQGVKEWKESIKKEMQEQMNMFQERMDEKLNQFEDKLDEQMEQYNKQLRERIEELKKLEKEHEQGESTGDAGDSTKSTSSKPYLGIRPSRAPSGSGVVVRQVKKNSPADRAGLKKGDVIRHMNGDSLNSVQSLQEQLYQFSPGDEVTLFVERNGWTKKVPVELGRQSGNSDQNSPDNGGGEDGSSSSSLQEGKLFDSDVIEDGKRAYWMLEMMTDYRHGRYLSFITNGVKRGIQILKEELNEHPLHIDARIRLLDRERGQVLFTLPVRSDLSEVVNRFDHIVQSWLKQTAPDASGSADSEFRNMPGHPMAGDHPGQ